MQQQRICDIGLATDASIAFHSMLRVIDGRSLASWQTSDIEHADVLMAHANADPAVLSAWNRSGKPVVLVIDDRCSLPPSPFVLRQPFRVMQLLAMLDRVAEHVSAAKSEAANECPAWAAANSLRQLMQHTGERGWHIALSADGAGIWVGDGHAHAAPATIERLREGHLATGPFATTDDAPPPASERVPLSDAAWFVGLHSPQDLAPWLAQDAAYRLRRWPDFGRVGAIPDMIELCAHTAAQACTPATLATLSGHTPAVVHRFLTASSLAGLLTTSPQAEAGAHARAVAPPATGWSRFVGDLRRHLRLVA